MLTNKNIIEKIEQILMKILIKNKIKNDKGLLTIFIEDYDFLYPDEGYIEVQARYANHEHVIHSVEKRDLPELGFGC